IGISAVPVQLVFFDETLNFKRVIGSLVGDMREGIGRRLVVCQLEQSAQQNRHVMKFLPRSGFDSGKHFMAEVSVGTAKIEKKINGRVLHMKYLYSEVTNSETGPHAEGVISAYQVSIHGRNCVSCVQALRGC